MPTCLKMYQIKPPGLGAQPVLADDATSTVILPNIAARTIVQDALPTALVNCQYVGISGAEYLALQAGPGAQEPFDYALAGSFFTVALSSVIGSYYLSTVVGSILGLIRRA